MVVSFARTEFAMTRCTAFMPNKCHIRRGGSTVYPVPTIDIEDDEENDGRCRVESSRGKRADVLSPADPMDANARSTSNWIISIPEQFGGYINPGDEWEDDDTGLLLTVGDLIEKQSYESEIRFVGVKQRIGTVVVETTFYRLDDDGDEVEVGPYGCQFAFDNNLPTLASNQIGGGSASYILGILVIENINADVQVEDRFVTADDQRGDVKSVLMQSPDRFEAVVQISVGGS